MRKWPPGFTSLSSYSASVRREKYGYAALEQEREMVAGSDELRADLCMAHLAHVSYGSACHPAGQLAPCTNLITR